MERARGILNGLEGRINTSGDLYVRHQMTWSSENERAGFEKCSALSYNLVSIGWLCFLASGIGIFTAVGILIKEILEVKLSQRSVLLILFPIVPAIIGFILNRLGWYLVKRKGFSYDYSSDTCSWKDA